MKTVCPGCGAELEQIEGPVHRYMEGTPACFAVFSRILAYEYADPALLATHRLTVDTYAVQHPGLGKTRQQIQSVGLHLARLGLQLAHALPPKETNDVMLGLGKHKHTLEYLEPPAKFIVTVADVESMAGTSKHTQAVRTWAQATWQDWADGHSYILRWTDQWM